ncbi:hypothetical protein RZR70_02570, partial [Escherichia coli]
MESDNRCAISLADGKRHRTAEQRYKQQFRNAGGHTKSRQGC